ncbi:hypothetical protein KAR91_00725 [Candidatus Pacearchaeota archaeon]|nr:hypothetical protein [Candidatus Pacearchaeota archaeon]
MANDISKLSKDSKYMKSKIATVDKLLRKNLSQDAKQLVIKQLQKYPENIFLLEKLAQCYYCEDNTNMALQSISRALKVCPKKPSLIWNAVWLNYEDSNFNKAIILANDILKTNNKTLLNEELDPRSLGWIKSLKNDCCLMLGLCYYEQKERILAKKWLKKYIAARKRGIKSQFSIKDASCKIRFLDIIDTIEKMDSDSPDEYKSELKLIRKALAIEPDDAWLLAQMSCAYYELRDYEKSLEIINKVLALAPHDPLYLWYYAGTLDMLNEKTQAIQLYKKIIRMGFHEIGCVETSEGIRWAKSLINDCKYRIGLCYKGLNKKKLAIKWIKEHLSNRRPGFPSVYDAKEVRKKVKEIELD